MSLPNGDELDKDIMQSGILYDLKSPILRESEHQDIETCKIIEALEDEQREIFEKLLPADLPPDIALTLNLDEEYWEHRCRDRWGYFDMWLYKSSWKTLYVQRSVEELIDSVDSSFNFAHLMHSLAAFKNDVYNLNIKGLPFISVEHDEVGATTVPDAKCSLGRYAGSVIALFSKAERIRLNVIPQNCGFLFDFEKFYLTDCDYDFLCHSILQIKSLKSFAFTCPGTSASRIAQMVDSLICLDNLTELNMSCNMISDDSAESIKRLLSLSSLENLILNNNNIGNEGTVTFSTALGVNSSLIFLDLSKNCIGDTGATCIFESLVKNMTLRKLDMKENLFGEEAGHAFIKLLKNSSSINYFNLSGNKMKKMTGKDLAGTIERNKEILFLDLRFCELDEEDDVFIQDSIERNLKHQNIC